MPFNFFIVLFIEHFQISSAKAIPNNISFIFSPTSKFLTDPQSQRRASTTFPFTAARDPDGHNVDDCGFRVLYVQRLSTGHQCHGGEKV